MVAKWGEQADAEIMAGFSEEVTFELGFEVWVELFPVKMRTKGMEAGEQLRTVIKHTWRGRDVQRMCGRELRAVVGPKG